MLQSAWAFKRKRYPDGALRTYKASICVRVDRHIEEVDVFDKYAPVMPWITVWLLLVLSWTLGLETHQVDYTDAFCQTPLEPTVFVNLPQRFEVPIQVLSLEQ